MSRGEENERTFPWRYGWENVLVERWARNKELRHGRVFPQRGEREDVSVER